MGSPKASKLYNTKTLSSKRRVHCEMTAFETKKLSHDTICIHNNETDTETQQPISCPPTLTQAESSPLVNPMSPHPSRSTVDNEAVSEIH